MKFQFKIQQYQTQAAQAVVEAIAKMRPLVALFRERAGDEAMSNFDEIFKNYSPDTDRRII